MAIVLAWLAGLVFGAGLILSGMADPAKVLAFLDPAGAWDPSLALVMAGAIGVAWLPFRWAERRGRTLMGRPLQLPAKTPITPRLALGSVVFGVGWGLVGFCPGPALVAVGMGLRPALVFVAAMLVGMALFEIAERLQARGRTAEV
jgi:uncharacterized protein